MSAVLESRELTVTSPNMVQDTFRQFKRELAAALVERDEEITLVMAALLCNEHCCFVGPPGTGKSMTIEAFCRWLAMRLFKNQLNKYMTPEELLGPISVIGLKNDDYRRILDGRAADCEILFLDEIFNASPSLLNSLLLLLNERAVYNGGVTVNTPLRLCVSASNLWPDGSASQELNALFDRFLFRKAVRPIASEKGINALLWGGLAPMPTWTISTSELNAAQAQVAMTPWTQEAKDAFAMIRRECRGAGVIVGDRRLKKSVMACQASAFIAGAMAVETEHLDILQHVLWVDPSEQPKTVEQIVGKVASPAMLEINKFLAEAEEIASSLIGKEKDLAAASSAAKKLDDISRGLKKLKGDRAADAAVHVDSIQKEIRRKALESM